MYYSKGKGSITIRTVKLADWSLHCKFVMRNLKTYATRSCRNGDNKKHRTQLTLSSANMKKKIGIDASSPEFSCAP
jgi:hypothetical protein